jgi:hypothetical protein
VIIAAVDKVVEQGGAVAERRCVGDQRGDLQIAVKVLEDGGPIVTAAWGDFAVPCAVDGQFLAQDVGKIFSPILNSPAMLPMNRTSPNIAAT